MGQDDPKNPLPRLPTDALRPLPDAETQANLSALAEDLAPPPAPPRPPYLPPRLGLPPPEGQRFRRPGASLCQSALAALVQALRARHIYEPGAEARLRHADTTLEKLKSLLQVTPRVELRVELDRLHLGEDVVYYHPDPREGLAGQWASGGLQQLTLSKGLDPAELDRLMGVLSTDLSLPEHRHRTLVDLLDAAEFTHVRGLGVRAAAPKPEPRPGAPAAVAPAAMVPAAQRRSGLQVVPARVAKEALARLTADELTADASLFAPSAPRPRAPSFAALAPPSAAQASPRPGSTGSDLVRVITRVEQVVSEIYGRPVIDETTVVGDHSQELLSSLRSLVEDYEAELDQETTAITTPVAPVPAPARPRSSGRRRRRRGPSNDDEPTQG